MKLIADFKTLKSPQRADLLSQMIYVHTKILKTKQSTTNNYAIIPVSDQIFPPQIFIQTEDTNLPGQQNISTVPNLPSNTPDHVPFQLNADELSSPDNHDNHKKEQKMES